jgi:hypothetical protein
VIWSNSRTIITTTIGFIIFKLLKPWISVYRIWRPFQICNLPFRYFLETPHFLSLLEGVVAVLLLIAVIVGWTKYSSPLFECFLFTLTKGSKTAFARFYTLYLNVLLFLTGFENLLHFFLSFKDGGEVGRLLLIRRMSQLRLQVCCLKHLICCFNGGLRGLGGL